ncbi:unnamed protein product [Parnassius apollo]|uniref:(apollo) hypothetical protein n=1 Tax=Parnassius apollo TaxID=110799 RepID=A0A8S3Y0T4_PARAO|nr:unnamed protein product [Parnassius apollo]
MMEQSTRANEEYIGRGDCGNAQYASRKSTATSPLSPKQAESDCREGSEPNAGYLFGSQPGPLRDGLNLLTITIYLSQRLGPSSADWYALGQAIPGQGLCAPSGWRLLGQMLVCPSRI